MITFSIEQAIKSLLQQELVILPTDTIFGISAVVSLQNMQKIQQIKQSPTDKKIIILTDDLTRLSNLIDTLSIQDIDLINSSANTSWLIPATQAPLWLKHDNKIVIRICKHPTIKEICQKLHAPLFSTSVNISNEPPLVDLKQIQNSVFADDIKGIVANLNITADNSFIKPSKIIDLDSKKTLRF